uniref:Uncharacterized protein n=1 Tax=Oryza barthii TaxID=65489 RepID=A0A0D3HRS7_9ORYZ
MAALFLFSTGVEQQITLKLPYQQQEEEEEDAPRRSPPCLRRRRWSRLTGGVTSPEVGTATRLIHGVTLKGLDPVVVVVVMEMEMAAELS